jgi:hypothetical protein
MDDATVESIPTVTSQTLVSVETWWTLPLIAIALILTVRQFTTTKSVGKAIFALGLLALSVKYAMYWFSGSFTFAFYVTQTALDTLGWLLIVVYSFLPAGRTTRSDPCEERG